MPPKVVREPEAERAPEGTSVNRVTLLFSRLDLGDREEVTITLRRVGLRIAARGGENLDIIAVNHTTGVPPAGVLALGSALRSFAH